MTSFEEQQLTKDLVSQWVSDTDIILNRFHLSLNDVELIQSQQSNDQTPLSFLPPQLESLIAMTTAVTALGTRLYGRFGAGKGLDKSSLNQVKKDADAISAYAMSECLWLTARHLPENHAFMVSLGEGLMPKAGESPEMGSNPQLGFGRVYAKPDTAIWVENRVKRLLNDPTYDFNDFYKESIDSGVIIWGAAIDTLENTSRFAKGEQTGPLTVLHLFDQPLCIAKPYEGYVGNLYLPEKVAAQSEKQGICINYNTNRTRVAAAIQQTYPHIKPENIHVWTLAGSNRKPRLGTLWTQWKEAGVHLIETGFTLPSGMEAFVDSGSYAPTYLVGEHKDSEGEGHIFICDGYAGSAEAMQSASLTPVVGLSASLSVFTSKFILPWDQEQHVMQIDPDTPAFQKNISTLTQGSLSTEQIEQYQEAIQSARDAGMPIEHSVASVDDFFPQKNWRVLAACGYICPDPYSGCPGVEIVSDSIFRVTASLGTQKGVKQIRFTLKSTADASRARTAFRPLLKRFLDGEDYRNRPNPKSDSGRIRNELQTLCCEALEHKDETIRMHFDRIPLDIISQDSQAVLYEALKWYKQNHPVLFSWLDIVK